MEAVEWTWINAALWALAAIVKFVVTPSAMIAAGHSFMATWAIASLGSAVGVSFFWIFGKWWFRWLESRWQGSEEKDLQSTQAANRLAQKCNGASWFAVDFGVDFCANFSRHRGEVFSRISWGDVFANRCLCDLGCSIDSGIMGH